MTCACDFQLYGVRFPISYFLFCYCKNLNSHKDMDKLSIPPTTFNGHRRNTRISTYQHSKLHSHLKKLILMLRWILPLLYPYLHVYITYVISLCQSECLNRSKVEDEVRNRLHRSSTSTISCEKQSLKYLQQNNISSVVEFSHH